MEKTKGMVHKKKWAFNRFLKLWRVSDDWTVAGSLFHDAGLHDHQSWHSNVERGDHHVLPCGVEKDNLPYYSPDNHHRSEDFYYSVYYSRTVQYFSQQRCNRMTFTKSYSQLLPSLSAATALDLPSCFGSARNIITKWQWKTNNHWHHTIEMYASAIVTFQHLCTLVWSWPSPQILKNF